MLKPGCIFKQIILTAGRLEAFANKHFLVHFDLSLTSLKILDALFSDGFLTPTQLMKKLGCTKSNITQRLNVMEKNNLIVRRGSQASDDRRTVMVGITDLGKEKRFEVIRMIKKEGIEIEKKLGTEETRKCHLFLSCINDLLDHYEA